MDMQVIEDAGDALLRGVVDALPQMRRNAGALDRAATFPEVDFAHLRSLGLLAAPLPRAVGGLGFGTGPEGADGLCRLLVLLGRGNAAIGRLFEAHVNAIALVHRYGDPAQCRRVAADAQAGHLFGLWVTGAAAGLTLDGPAEAPLLDGRRDFCSGAGWASRALLTVDTPEGPRMVLADVTAARVENLPAPPQGMRAAANGRMLFDQIPVARDARIGAPGDYLREPAFSAGAWRTSAVTAGCLHGLIEEARAQLVARRRADDPHQLARIGDALVAQETALLWVRKAARLAEQVDGKPDDITGFVNLARRAVEAASLEAIPLVQRSLGLAAFVPPNPAERIMRDLATYLRQPAGDEALTEAAGHFMQRDLPEPT